MFVNIRDLSVLLQCNEESVRRWIRAGKLKVFRGPGGQRVDLHSVDLPEGTRERLIAAWQEALDKAAAKALAS